MEKIQIGVGQLLQFVMRSGDIDNTYRSNRRMLEGIKAHKRIQDAYGSTYRREAPLRNETLIEEVLFQVDGRADGIYEGEEIFIDEIKSTTRKLKDVDPEENGMHWAQAMCYAYFYCIEEEVSSIGVQLTYVSLEEDFAFKKMKKVFSLQELRHFYVDLLKRFLGFSRILIAWRKKRDQSFTNMRFPYATYRKGQREMAVGVFEAIEKKKPLFVEAPTGIGKTVSALVPALFSIVPQKLIHIFYLTARNTTQREPVKALQLLQEQGMAVKTVQLSAREKICLNDKVSCNPVDCPYAKGHFDRVNDAVVDLFQKENLLTPNIITQFAEKHAVCPHEFQLDMSDYSEVILCDYNYAFDPQVQLKRVFDDNTKGVVLLVDEAHNLADRGRDMYTAKLSTAEFQQMADMFKEKKGYKGIYKALQKCRKELEESAKPYLKGSRGIANENSDDFYQACKSLLGTFDRYLTREKGKEHYDEVYDFFFAVMQFTRIEELWTTGFFNFFYKEGKETIRKIRCLDTSEIFGQFLKKVDGAIFFSATLSPMSFYQELLGGGERSLGMKFPSPFPKENFKLITFPVSTRYSDRDRTLEQVASGIGAFVQAKKGNYMIFFPSYTYMTMVQEVYEKRYGKVLTQSPNLGEKERREILNTYEENRDTVGFFVLGGLFAEGVDFAGEKLIGCAVVSVGLPGISFELNVMKTYFDKKSGRGFDYTYTFPGMNKVEQAAGRVIRREEDRGCVLLIDDRFSQRKYRALMPKHWENIQTVQNIEQLSEELRSFWDKGEEDGEEET